MFLYYDQSINPSGLEAGIDSRVIGAIFGDLMADARESAK